MVDDDPAAMIDYSRVDALVAGRSLHRQVVVLPDPVNKKRSLPRTVSEVLEGR